MRILPLILIGTFALLSPSCTNEDAEDPGERSYAISLADSTGHTLQLESLPRKVVSLAPTITDTIFLLGAEDNLVGVTDYCPLPEAKGSIARVGLLLDPSLERIIALSPDLILATKEGNVPAPIAKLREAGLAVFVLGEKRNLDDIKSQTLTIAKLLGKEEVAKRLADGCDTRLAELNAKVGGLPKPKVFVELNHRPLMTAASDTFLDEMVSRAGGINIARALERYPIYSLERVVAENPEVILIVSMGEMTKEALALWEEFPELSAVKAGRVHVLDADKFCAPSLAEFPECVGHIMEILSMSCAGDR